MVLEIQSKEVVDKVSDELKVQPSLEIPRELAEKVQLTFDVNPQREIKVVDNQKSTTGTATIKTFSDVKRTFITKIVVGITADAANDSTVFRTKFLPLFGDAGSTGSNIWIPHTIGLIRNDLYCIDFGNKPVEVVKGSTVQHILSFAAGTGTHAVQIYYYETDPQ